MDVASVEQERWILDGMPRNAVQAEYGWIALARRGVWYATNRRAAIVLRRASKRGRPDGWCAMQRSADRVRMDCTRSLERRGVYSQSSMLRGGEISAIAESSQGAAHRLPWRACEAEDRDERRPPCTHGKGVCLLFRGGSPRGLWYPYGSTTDGRFYSVGITYAIPVYTCTGTRYKRQSNSYIVPYSTT